MFSLQLNSMHLPLENGNNLMIRNDATWCVEIYIDGDYFDTRKRRSKTRREVESF